MYKFLYYIVDLLAILRLWLHFCWYRHNDVQILAFIFKEYPASSSCKYSRSLNCMRHSIHVVRSLIDRVQRKYLRLCFKNRARPHEYQLQYHILIQTLPSLADRSHSTITSRFLRKFISDDIDSSLAYQLQSPVPRYTSYRHNLLTHIIQPTSD